MAGLVVQTKPGTVPQLKRYLDEQRGVAISDVWTDIPPLNSQSAERLGYPTQKPLALLERILRLSSNEGDVILDPFCGCGTAVHAAQKLNREWIGIDITHLAVSLIEKRIKDAFPGILFEVHGTPKDLEGARDLANRDKYQFQWWDLLAGQRAALSRQEEGRGWRHRRDHLLSGRTEGAQEDHRFRQGRRTRQCSDDPRSGACRGARKGRNRPLRHPDAAR
jgi:site-specific DNA-methyltransferase (adenine-specific)